MGFPFPALWVIGLFYIFSKSSVRRAAGFASLISVAVFIACIYYNNFLLKLIIQDVCFITYFVHKGNPLAVVGVALYWTIALASTITLSCIVRNKLHEKMKQRSQLRHYLVTGNLLSSNYID
jgi:hypothetical protein